MNKAFELILERLNEVKKIEIQLHGGRCNGKTLKLGYAKGIENAIKIVQEVAEEYKGGWIQVSECLPNQDGEFTDVLITCESMVDGVFVQSAEFYLASDGSLVFDALYHYDKVLAWKPLPEPYKEK